MSQNPTRGIIVNKLLLATNTNITNKHLKHLPRRTPRPYSLNIRTDGGRGGRKLRAHRDALHQKRSVGLPVTTD